VFVVCCVGRGLCSKLITHSEKSYWTCVCVRVWSRNLTTEAAYAQVELLHHRKKKIGAHLQNVHVLGSLMARSAQRMTAAHETSNKSNVTWRYKRYCDWMCVCVMLQVSDQGGGIPRSHTDLLFNYMFSTAPQPPKSDAHTTPLAGRYPVCLVSLPLI